MCLQYNALYGINHKVTIKPPFVKPSALKCLFLAGLFHPKGLGGSQNARFCEALVVWLSLFYLVGYYELTFERKFAGKSKKDSKKFGGLGKSI